MKDLEIVIEPTVMEKIQCWVNEAEGECSGLGKVEIIDNCFYINDAILLDQKNSSASTDLEAKAIGRAMFDLRDVAGDLNWWWHSHVNMDTYFSGVDKDTIVQIGQHGYCVATVFNKKGKIHSGYYQGAVDNKPSFFINNVPTRSGVFIDQDVYDGWIQELKEKCKKKTFKTTIGLGKHTTRETTRQASSTLITGDYDWRKDPAHMPVGKRWNVRKQEWESFTDDLSGLEPHEITCSAVPDKDFDEWYELFYQIHGIEPLSGSQLDEFYEEWKDSISDEDEASDSKYGGKNA